MSNGEGTPVESPVISNTPVDAVSYVACSSEDVETRSSGHLVVFGDTAWRSSFDHRPLKNETAYLISQVLLGGTVTDNASTLNGIFDIYGESLVCETIDVHIDIEAVVPDSSAPVSDSWTSVTFMPQDSNPQHCSYSFEIAADQIQTLFEGANQNQEGGVRHQLAIVMSGVQGCTQWDSRSIVDITENGATPGNKFSMAPWLAEFGTP